MSDYDRLIQAGDERGWWDETGSAALDRALAFIASKGLADEFLAADAEAVK